MNKEKLRRKLLRLRRKLCYYCYTALPVPMPKADPHEPVDVVIPVVAKDLDVLPLCLEGLRRNMSNRLGDIFLVSPDSEEVRRFASDNGLSWVDERSVLGYDKQHVGYTDRRGRDRSGWLFQQLLKLSGAVGTHRYFVTIDSDHILLRPHTFLAADGRCVFYRSKEYHRPYYLFTESLLGRYPRQWLSFVAHKMIFDKQQLQCVHRLLESLDEGKSWDEVIVSRLKQARFDASFSEFEFYGHLFPRQRMRCVAWRQKMLRKSSDGVGETYAQLRRRFGWWSRSVTFPAYLAKKKVASRS